MEDIPVLQNSGRQAVIMRLENILKGQMNYVQENGSYGIRERLEQIDVLVNMNKILQNYDELKPVLTEYFNKKHENEKWGR